MSAPHAGRAWLVVLGGVAAAVHVGKLPPAIPVLRDALGLTLVEAGFLLSLVQFAGMTLGLLAGLAADSLGLKRTMVAGLWIVGGASVVGGWADGAAGLLVLRGIEGFGFLLASMPAPGLIRRLVPPDRMSTMLGVWGAYMPFATALALLCGPAWMAWTGWPGWWWLLGGFSLLMAAWLGQALPPDPVQSPTAAHDWVGRIGQTLAARGPWLVAAAFGVYSAQWLSVIGFLPSIYLAAGIAPASAAAGTALAAAVNMVGNLASGRLLQRGFTARRLMSIGFLTMGFASVIAFSPLLGPPESGALLRYLAVLAFSAVGGMIPGTLFSLAVRLAPSERTVSTTVGWMQQWSSLGQFLGPPLVAWVAARSGGWQWSWLVTGGCALGGLMLAGWTSRLPQVRGH
ncbi:MFS transporter [Ramlibacter tataouinensis]|uniref:MFS transporter n=1 Tax=Ramlibacter tataouinensis TaxID=94132 RepID=UPI0022F3D937|nr:MFS transporter [Ramlibacter tataouinensis]WBY03526.1 MFS transporter [Ramlibacter tataouinensis]